MAAVDSGTGRGAVRSLAPWLSRLQLERLVAAGRERDAPLSAGLEGALLFLDVAGFTPLTETYARSGPRGAELLTELLRAYFGPVLKRIDAHGGDVLFFAGDALAALWPTEPESGTGLHAAALRAARCALDVQRSIAAVTPPGDSRLSFRASLAAGGLRAFDVGGLDGRWLQLVRGEPLYEVHVADRLARPGDVVFGEEFLRQLEGVPLHAEPFAPGAFRLAGLEGDYVPAAVGPLDIPDAIESALAGCVPRIVAERIAAGQSEYLAEFRQVTVVFASLLAGASEEASRQWIALATLHQAVRAVQETAERFGGVVDQLLEDDKGASVILGFGLPGSSHDDDALRGISAARAAHERLLQLGLAPVSGIATGSVFCGIHGGDQRRHYSLLGPPTNLAARLMQEGFPGEILCDDATRRAAGRRLAFRERGSTTPKGFAAPIAVFEPAGEIAPQETAAPAHVIGRMRELEFLRGRLRRLVDESVGATVFIEAKAGMGKSTIMAAFDAIASEAPVDYARGGADSLETGTAYYAFRDVVRRWLDIRRTTPAAEARAHVAARLAASTEFAPLAPLLNGVLGLDLPETELTRQLQGQLRAESLQRLLLHIARGQAAVRPLVLCLEDGHWMDSASWGLLGQLARAIPSMLAVVSTRPRSEAPVEYGELQRQLATETLALDRLTRDETADLIRRQLDVEHVPDDVVARIDERAEGNPFFAKELVRTLRESGALRVSDGRCELEPGAEARLPATLEGVITARIDRLGSAPQLTLKVAAVIGRDFEEALLRRVHPAAPAAEQLEEQLEELAAAELVVSETFEDARRHRFTHALTREATYNLLPYAQRQTLHRATAEELERAHAENVQPVQARLAHHFRMAQLPERAIPHLAGAGESALNAYACREAVEFLTDALSLDRQVHGEGRRDLRRARWCRFAGEALYHQNRYHEARQWFEAAVRAADPPVRTGVGGAVTGVVPLLVRSARARGVPRARIRRPQERERCLESIRSMRELSAVYLWEADQLRFALNTVNMARIAMGLGPSTESPYAIGIFAYMLSLSGLRGIAERQSALSVRMAEDEADLTQIASANMMRGMLLRNHGHFERSLRFHERSVEAADALRAGLYRHRTRYQAGEALVFRGHWERARRQLSETAEISSVAEPHVEGLANSMIALTLLREGRIDEALRRLERTDCIPLLRREGVVLSIVTGFGILAEARFDAGDVAGALEAVREAESAFHRSDNSTSYFNGVLGYRALTRVRIEAGDAGPRRGRATQLDIDMARLRRLARMCPGALCSLRLMEGLREVGRGRPRRARALLVEAIRVSERAPSPWELGRSCMALASLSGGSERDALLRRAHSVFVQYCMPFDAERAARALRSG